MTFNQWKTAVLAVFPDAQFTQEDGSGNTYGEDGDWFAHTGPDMQADIVGGFFDTHCYIVSADRQSDTEYPSEL